MKFQNLLMAFGLAGAVAIGTAASASAGPLPTGIATVKSAPSDHVTDIQWRGRGFGYGYRGYGYRGYGYRGYGYGLGYYPYYGAYGLYGGCYRSVRVFTPYGPRWRRVWVCG